MKTPAFLHSKRFVLLGIFLNISLLIGCFYIIYAAHVSLTIQVRGVLLMHPLGVCHE